MTLQVISDPRSRLNNSDAIVTITEHSSLSKKEAYQQERLSVTTRGKIELASDGLYIRDGVSDLDVFDQEKIDMTLIKEMDAHIHIEMVENSAEYYSSDAAIALYQNNKDYIIKLLNRPTKYHILVRAANIVSLREL